MTRKTIAVLLSVLLLMGTSTAASAAEPPKNCQGELVSFAVQLLGGRRKVASTFFGDYPQAVQDAESFAKALCGF